MDPTLASNFGFSPGSTVSISENSKTNQIIPLERNIAQLVPLNKEFFEKNKNIPQFYLRAKLLRVLHSCKHYKIVEVNSLCDDLKGFKVPHFLLEGGVEKVDSLQMAIGREDSHKVYFYLNSSFDRAALDFNSQGEEQNIKALTRVQNIINKQLKKFGIILQQSTKSISDDIEDTSTPKNKEITEIREETSSVSKIALKELKRSRHKGTSILKLKETLAINKDIPQFTLEVGELIDFNKARIANNIPELQSLWDDFTEFKVPSFVKKGDQEISEAITVIIKKYKTDLSHRVFFYLASNYNVKALDLDVKLITKGTESKTISLILNKIKTIFEPFSFENKSKTSSLVESSLGITSPIIPASKQMAQPDKVDSLKKFKKLKSVALISNHQGVLKKNNFIPQFFIEAGLLDSFRITKMVCDVDELDSLWNDLIAFKVPTFIITNTDEEEFESLEGAVESDPKHKIYFYLTSGYDAKSLLFDPKTLDSDLLSNKHNPISSVQEIIKLNLQKFGVRLQSTKPQANSTSLGSTFFISENSETNQILPMERNQTRKLKSNMEFLELNKNVPKFYLRAKALRALYNCSRRCKLEEVDSLLYDLKSFKVPRFLFEKGKEKVESLQIAVQLDDLSKIYFYLNTSYDNAALTFNSQGEKAVDRVQKIINNQFKKFGIIVLRSFKSISDDIEVTSTPKKSKKPKNKEITKNTSLVESSLRTTSPVEDIENSSKSSSKKRKRDETVKLSEQDELQTYLTTDPDSFWDFTNKDDNPSASIWDLTNKDDKHSVNIWDMTDEELGIEPNDLYVV